ncbi:uncharacterized protein LOC108915422 [Anoplophora glabripennis]|uniref:uncharacterized protein LOC108915422 n=1 Tax=Anoplophora glabripennis TaxID=217634 RepID=UPI000873678E|nr:uncharacterized protein LOC108915422 [Anoplophora glabripennis]
MLCTHVLENIVLDLIKYMYFLNLPMEQDCENWMAYKLFHTQLKVQSIIDCLEIEIEQSSNAPHQALTWSNYKKTNTLKYLISSTPDGIINFISEGFGGRITDKEIIEASDFLNALPPCDVMADRGFKAIAGLSKQKNCNLVRPSSVESGTKSTKEEVKGSKHIASLRIHIERVIRFREFTILDKHACLNHELVPKLDFFIIVACGIVNLQGPLIIH